MLQFVIERGLGLDVEAEMQRRFFRPLAMPNTSLIWQPHFARNLADGWREHGSIEPHGERSKVRSAGSMDASIADPARLVAAYVRFDELSKNARAAMVAPQARSARPRSFFRFSPSPMSPGTPIWRQRWA